MPYLTLIENLKLQLSPGLVASYDIQSGNGVGLFWDIHMNAYLHTCPGPTQGNCKIYHKQQQFCGADTVPSIGRGRCGTFSTL